MKEIYVMKVYTLIKKNGHNGVEIWSRIFDGSTKAKTIAELDRVKENPRTDPIIWTYSLPIHGNSLGTSEYYIIKEGNVE